MCGIIGYIQNNNPNITKDILCDLQKLEYRGYDSAGICVISNGEFVTTKSLGEIKNLQQKTSPICATCGIAHTRWATHGNVSLQNTHPHFDNKNEWSVVHNGIIENHIVLKNKLKKISVTFYGETDTEVIPNLISFSNPKNNLHKFKTAINQLCGSFAICAINKFEPNTIYIARKNSPLFVAKNQQQTIASSDPVCFGERFLNYFVVPNDCIAKITNLSVEFFDFNLNPICAQQNKIGLFEQSASLGKYPYFAEKEINQTPFVLNNIIQSYQNTNYFKNITKSYLKDIKNIYLIGCGTAYHACLMGQKYLEQQTDFLCSSHIASEFRYSNPKIDKHTLCIFASQSGETADTILCQNLAKQKGAKTLCLVNVPYSTLARNCDIVLPICAGMEVAVISTKAYNAMLFVFYLLASCINCVLHNKTTNNISSVLVPLLNTNFFKNKNKINQFVDLTIASDKVFFIGKNQDYITSLEAGLKLKEITYINCVSLPSGELKHGTLALVDNNSLVFVIVTHKELLEKNLSSASEIKSRGGKVVLVTNLKLNKKQLQNIDYVFNFEPCHPDFSSMLSIIFFQQLAYKTCVKLGKNPDKPRNLAKSVTVE